MVLAALICFAILLIAWIAAPDAPPADHGQLLTEGEVAAAA